MSEPQAVGVEVHGGKTRRVIIPGSWKQVTEGNVEKNDMYFNLMSNDFVFVEDDDIGQNFEQFNLLVRHKESKTKLINQKLELASRKAIRHRAMVLDSNTCGCYYCYNVYPPTEIKQWTDQGQTAICPICDIDSVLPYNAGYPLTIEFLREMHNYWFGVIKPTVDITIEDIAKNGSDN